MNSPVIDTSSLLTMLCIIAAAWAVVPASSRLFFRLSFSYFDWLIIWAGTLAIHILVFEQVLRAVSLYPDFGQWIWGFDKNGLIYLLFLVLAIYIYLRTRTTRLSQRSLDVFEQLTTSLLHTRKFDDLGEILHLHLETVLNLCVKQSMRHRLADWLYPAQSLSPFTVINRQLVPLPAIRQTWLKRSIRRTRITLSRVIQPNERGAQRARSIARTLLASRSFVEYLTRAYPYLCLRVMERANSLIDDFQDEFFTALLADEGSIFFLELKNNHNLRRGHRLHIPPENQLISFYLLSVETAARLGVYRSVGEALLSKISFDSKLVGNLNGPLITYADVGYHRCPIAGGIHFFRIMILEGLHQRIHDHLWLHYVTHFVDRILEYARDARPEDEITEFSTPFCYLLYQIVDVTADWIEEAIEITDKNDVVTPVQSEGHHVYIAFEAATALGGVIQSIFLSSKVPNRLKCQLLSVVLHAYKRVRQNVQLNSLVQTMEQSIVRPYNMKARRGYLDILRQVYFRQDHVLRLDTQDFQRAIQTDD